MDSDTNEPTPERVVKLLVAVLEHGSELENVDGPEEYEVAEACGEVFSQLLPFADGHPLPGWRAAPAVEGAIDKTASAGIIFLTEDGHAFVLTVKQVS